MNWQTFIPNTESDNTHKAKMPELTLIATLILSFAAAGVLTITSHCIRVRKKRLVRDKNDAFEQTLWSLRNTWDHLPRFIPMDGNWQSVCIRIARAIPHLHSNHTRWNIYRPCFSSHKFGILDWQSANENHRELSKIVAEINDPKLNSLWDSGRLIDLVEILRLGLFKTWQPGFDLSPMYREPSTLQEVNQ